jgi:prepilin-type N-terminal cleavage/methylation domain-containing protein
MIPGGKRQNGFTLIEIVVVMVIVGMAMFMLLPSLDYTNQEDMSDAGKLSSLSTRARLSAMNLHQNQAIEFALGGNYVNWNGKEIELAGAVSRAFINGKEPPGLERSIRLFPDGHMDQCRLEMSTGETISCDPLKGMFAYE